MRTAVPSMEDNHRNNSSVSRTALLSVLALSWLLLAALQYKWATELRNATEARLHSNLELSLANWQRDLYEQLSAARSLDSKALQNELFPALTERHFHAHDGLDYRVAILAMGKTPTIVYSSDPALKAADVERFDSQLRLFGAGPSSSQNRPWVLFAAYRAGTIAAVANAAWYRHLILAAVLLLSFTAGIALLVALQERERRLAKLQIEFVASVSHELRTPLSAIFSAGENLRDGYIDGQKDLKFYGSILTSQSRRLIELVDRILLFASTSAGNKRYPIVRLSAPEILAALRRNMKDELADERRTLEEHIDPSLPEVFGDLSGICICLQNLLGNAAKYGGEDRWIGFSVTRYATDAGVEVAFRVQDHGRGIRAAEFQKIFEPFYRSPDVLAAKIQGAGLGLALAKRIAESLGGRITVVSEVGVGSTFTLQLRAAPAQPIIEPSVPAKTDTVNHE